MLSFLRKYQGVVLAIVGASLILPFTFFGTYRAMGAFEQKKDRLLAQALDNSKIMLSDVQQLGRMLGMEKGLFLEELLRTGLAERIANAYGEALREEWQTRFERSKKQRFYVHPMAPALNARVLWNQFAPGLVDEVGALQEQGELPADFFKRWAKIYLMQEKCPAELIRRILIYQQSQMKNTPPDPKLMSENFALFGYQNAQEWFGRSFFDLVAQVVMNGAAKAGKVLSDADVEKDLQKRFVSKQGDLLQAMGIRRGDAVRLWKKALLCTQYFQERGEEAAAQSSIEEMEREVAYGELYSLPEELQMHGADDLLAFKLYEKLVCQKGNDGLPKAFLKEEEVEKRAPELLMTRYRIRYVEADLQKIASRIPIREVWEWQLAHWKEMRKQFSAIPDAEKEKRFQTLEKCDAKLRSSADEWSREQIVLEHPDWIEAEFASALLQDREVMISQDGKRVDGMIVSQVPAFRAALDGWKEEVVEFRDRKKTLRLQAVERVPGREVLSLAAAKEKGLLKTDRFLQELYEKVRTASPAQFQDEKGSWKSISSVKEEVVRRSFGEKTALLHKAMEKKLEHLAQGGDLSFGLWTLTKSEKSVEESLQLPGSWALVDDAFFFLKEKRREKVDSRNSLRKVEAMGAVADCLLSEIIERKAYFFPMKDIEV